MEAVYCEAVNSWVLGGNDKTQWMCCPWPYCIHMVSMKCARKNWPYVKYRTLRPKCFGKYGTQPELLCDTCPSFNACIKETIK